MAVTQFLQLRDHFIDLLHGPVELGIVFARPRRFDDQFPLLDAERHHIHVAGKPVKVDQYLQQLPGYTCHFWRSSAGQLSSLLCELAHLFGKVGKIGNKILRSIRARAICVPDLACDRFRQGSLLCMKRRIAKW